VQAYLLESACIVGEHALVTSAPSPLMLVAYKSWYSVMRHSKCRLRIELHLVQRIAVSIERLQGIRRVHDV